MNKEKEYGIERKAETPKMRKCCNKNTADNSSVLPTAKAKNLYGEPTMTDPLGSYTGQPIEKYEKPVQDADDL